MSWLYAKYESIKGDPEAWPRFDVTRSRCPYCGTRIKELDRHHDSRVLSEGGYFEDVDATLAACSICGWWVIAAYENSGMQGHNEIPTYTHLHSVLERCDVSTVGGPADELQRYLLHNYDQRFEVSPFAFEDVVGQVFRNHGYQVEATARSRDGGIDLFVAEKAGRREAVEVKRYKRKIGVGLVREFAGALMIAGTTRGIYVTTSSFTMGAISAAERLKELHWPIKIELLDAEGFYDAMGFRREKVYSSANDAAAPFSSAWKELCGSYWADEA